MAINLDRVTFGNAQRGWTAGSIAPRAPISGPIANVGTSGNIPANILQAVGNLSAEQAFRNFLSGQVMNQQPQAAPAPSIDVSAILQAQNVAAQQNAAQRMTQGIQWNLANVNQQLNTLPTGFGGISPMGSATRANLQNQQFALENQLGAAPRISGWLGGF